MTTYAYGAMLDKVEIMERLSRGDLIVAPLDSERQSGPVFINIRLGFEFNVLNIADRTHLNRLTEKKEITKNVPHYASRVHAGPVAPFVLPPGGFALAGTLEYFRIPKDLAGRLEGRSSCAQLGLQVHTAGLVDPGFEGILTLEIQNTGEEPLRLFPGVRIAHICFFKTNRGTNKGQSSGWKASTEPVDEFPKD